jgi:hypothetical protein
MKGPTLTQNKLLLFVIFLLLVRLSFSQNNEPFLIFLSNDDCADFTWGFDEKTTRDNSVKLVAAYLDEMKLTDNHLFENKSRYTCTVTNELLFFLEKFPEKRAELMKRIKEGRIMISPFLCNNLWGLPGSETFIRSMYPAARLAKEAGVSLNRGVHSELPSLPGGIVPLLAGAGISWIGKPYLDWDCTFGKLQCPPLFILKGADNSLIKVSLDHWACERFAYEQGAVLIKLVSKNNFHYNDSTSITKTWINHYNSLKNYPLQAALTEGTHCDLNPFSWQQPYAISTAIRAVNGNADGRYRIINSTFDMFADYVDSVQNNNPFMDTLKGSFGISWEVWPVSQAKCITGLREQERRLYKTEALLALSGDVYNNNSAIYKTYTDAEWNLIMLTDHAYNGTDNENRKVNSSLRRNWLIKADSLISLLTYEAIRLVSDKDSNTFNLFNPNNFQLKNLCYLNEKDLKGYLSVNIPPLGFQTITREEFKNKLINFSTRTIPEKKLLSIGGTNVDNLFSIKYKLDSAEYSFQPENYQEARSGELSFYSENGQCAHLKVLQNWTIISSESRIDLELKIERPQHAHQEILSLDVDIPWNESDLRLETTGEILKPYPAPRGNLLPGADTTRFVIQNFISCELGKNRQLHIISPDAFVVVNKQNKISIQLFSNIYDKGEAVMNQNNETAFTYRFSFLITDNLNQDEIIRKSREIIMTPLVFQGKIQNKSKLLKLNITPGSILITSLKPAEPAFGKGIIVKVWNTSGTKDKLQINANNYNGITNCNLLENNTDATLTFTKNYNMPVNPLGYKCFRLE